MLNKDDWIKSLEDENKQYEEFLSAARDIGNLVPNVQERKKETEAKLIFVQSVPEEYLIELGDTLFALQKDDEEQTRIFLPKLPDITTDNKRFLSSGTTNTSTYAEMSYKLQAFKVNENSTWIFQVNEVFSSLADEKAKKKDLPLKLDKINQRLGEMFSVALQSVEKAKSGIVGIDQAAIHLRDILQQLWGGLAKMARERNRSIKDSKLELMAEKHRGFVVESLIKDDVRRRKLQSLLNGMAEIHSELSDTNFGKNPLTDDLERLVNLYSRWLLVIDDVTNYLILNLNI